MIFILNRISIDSEINYLVQVGKKFKFAGKKKYLAGWKLLI